MLELGPLAKIMSTQCRYFEQHAWKREICTNCFKTREEHVGNSEYSKPIIARASANLKTDVQKLQSILRARTSQVSRRKNVAFPESLTEVIGYGGNDFSDTEDANESDDLDSYDLEKLSEEDVPDSEEDRALGNLTRANTNFNTVTANLTDDGNSESKTGKAFASLMLGKVQKDSDGKKKTLLVSVTPFGADDSLPSAKRPAEKKKPSALTSNGKAKREENSNVLSLPEIGKIEKFEKIEANLSNLPKSKISILDSKDKENSGLEKIVDMPLITSSNLISVIQKSDALTIDFRDEKISEKRAASITRSPAIKKPESEKPKIQALSFSGKSDQRKKSELEKGSEGSDFDSGLDMNENTGKMEEKEEKLKTRDVNKIEILSRSNEIASLCERTVEGEAGPEPILLSNRPFSYEDSREKAGEPDGKADEDQTSEPPALPRTLPPNEQKNVKNVQKNEQRSSLVLGEPRTSFLHGETRTKPVVPQKPISLPSKMSPKSVNSSEGFSMRNQNGSYVLPPPSVKNVPGLQNAQRLGNKENSQDLVPWRLGTSSQNGEQLKTFQSANESKRSKESESKDSKIEKFEIANEALVKSQILSPGNSFSKCVIQEKTEVETKIRENGDVKIQEKEAKIEGSNLSEDEDSGQSTEEESRPEVSPDSPTELIRASNKRRMAPKPPAAPIEELPASIFARNPAAILKSDSPVVREKEKRERASSCSPKFRKAICSSPDPCAPTSTPEAAPRRNISLSQGSLANVDKAEEKKKTRPRFSLKRLLRMGTRKDVEVTSGHVNGTSSRSDEIPTTPQPKPRLEIIHPLELDGAAVEVLGNERVVRNSQDVTDSKTESVTQSPGNHHVGATRPGKPPPPPRSSQSQDDWSRLSESKPVRPPPPRSEAKLPGRSEKAIFSKSWQPSSSPPTTDSIYANLAAEDVTGEVRSGLAPSKPQRTSSMRDQTVLQPPMKKRNLPCDIAHQNYDKDDSLRPPSSDSPTSNDSNVYECLSSSPECDSTLELRHPLGGNSPPNSKRKSDSAMDSCNGEFKYHQTTFARSTSLPYCGSETESELYAPYSFYTGDEGAEEDQDWKSKEEDFGMNRVRQRRGRSIVHRSLEDNYGAVIVANHEALAQLLERLNQPSPVPANLRGLKTANLRLTDFDLETDSLVALGKKIFCAAMWNEHSVTLCLTLDTVVPVSGKEFSMSPIIEFIDVVPEKVSMKCFAGRTNVDASVSVFGRMQVNSIQGFAVELSRDQKNEAWLRESCFVLLQLVNAMKNLQARGIEESPKNLNNVVLCREDKDSFYRLYLLQGLNVDTGEVRDEERVSLCQCALVALRELGLDSKLPVIRELLIRERAVTLSQVKSILEFSLWGPADAMLGVAKEREIVLQRWLDLERANVLHALVRTRPPLTVNDEYQLIFLVRTSARIMCEASVLLDEQNSIYPSS